MGSKYYYNPIKHQYSTQYIETSMDSSSNRENKYINELKKRFEAASQKGTVDFIEETALCDLLEHFVRIGDWQTVRSIAAYGLASHPFSTPLHLYYAEGLIRNEALGEALEVLNKALTLSPRDNEILMLKAQVLLEMERFSKAEEVLNSIRREEDSSGDLMSDVSLFYAIILENKDNYYDMFDEICNALRLDPDNEYALEKLGLCTEFSQRYEETVTFLTEYLDERPYSSLAWYNLGHAHLYLDQTAQALEAFEYAYLTCPEYEYAYLDRGEVLMNNGLFEKALTCYTDGLEHLEYSTPLLIGKAESLVKLGRFDRAKANFKKVLGIESGNEEAYYGLGNCYAGLGQFHKGLKAYLEAYRLNDRREEYIAAIAEMYLNLGDIKSAETAFIKTTEIAPEFLEYWIRLVMFYMDENRYQKAYEVIEEAELNAGGVELEYCRVAVLLKEGRRQEGLRLLVEAAEHDETLFGSFFELCDEFENDREVLAIYQMFR